jgi:hypothetical protein
LVSELRNARDLSHAPKESEQYAFVQALFDALIVLGKPVPSEAVWPFFDDRAPECLILLTRSDTDEESLLSLRDSDLDTPEWLVVNNLLLRMHSGLFIADMIKAAGTAHDFDVSDPGPGHTHGGSDHIGWGCCPPDVVRRFLPRFPPIGVYKLLTASPDVSDSPGTGDVLLMAARHPVYYRRTLVPTGGSVQWPGRYPSIATRRFYCIDFLADASRMDPSFVRLLFAGYTSVPWTGDLKTFERTTGEALSAQEAGIRKLVESARQAGFHHIPPLRVRIATRILDHRAKSHDPLPTLDYQPFVIN